MVEVKLQVTYESELLPPVYVTDHLYLGESGACIIYMLGEEINGMFIRYATADAPQTLENIIKLGAATNSLVKAYAGNTAQPVIVITGTLTADVFASKEMKLTSVALRMGAIIFAKADYLGTYPPSKTATPSQQYLCFDASMSSDYVTAAVEQVVATNLKKAIIAKFYS